MTEPLHIQDLIAIRRRTLFGSLLGLPLLTLAHEAAAAPPAFASLPPDTSDTITVPPGYRAQTLIAWGDALFDTVAPSIDLDRLTRVEQEQRFGQNSDMIALFPETHAFPPPRENRRFLMCVNNEYSEPSQAFPSARSLRDFDTAKIETLFASMGVTVVQVDASDPAAWRVIRDAHPGAGKNRRITPYTPVAFAGPAANHRWIAAATPSFRAASPGTADGLVPCGTLANCAGGQTPWGTYLTAEENFDYAFKLSGESEALTAARNDTAWVWSSGSFGNPLLDDPRRRLSPDHFDVTANPYGPSLYGWIVEIDPYDPHSTPRKRTALGRMKHECATTAIARTGQCVVYMGDDQANEFVYKFVSRDAWNPHVREANRELLDHGALYVAKFEANGSGRWLPLTVETANAAAAGYTAPFTDMGDVVMRAREAAKLMGATPMDRPEDVEALCDANWVGTGQVFVACTNNRAELPIRPGNPRREGAEDTQANVAGHILRIDERGNCAAATRFRWDAFAVAGDPDAGAEPAPIPQGDLGRLSVKYKGRPTFSGARFACPDNICFDEAQNIWIATDGSSGVFPDCNDSVLVTTTAGRGPREVKRFLIGPVGAEMCGPTMTPDQRAFLVAVQHPGESDPQGISYSQRRWGNPGAAPPSHFPDGGDAWPRSAIVLITKHDGGVIGA